MSRLHKAMKASALTLALLLSIPLTLAALFVAAFMISIALPIEIIDSERIAAVRAAVSYVERGLYVLEAGGDKEWLEMEDLSEGNRLSKEQERFGIVFHRRKSETILQCPTGFDSSVRYNMTRKCWDLTLAGSYTFLSECPETKRGP